MSLDFSSSGHEQKDERSKRIVKIIEEFSKLTTEMQECVIKFAESLIKENKVDGQDPTT